MEETTHKSIHREEGRTVPLLGTNEKVFLSLGSLKIHLY